MGLSPDEVGIDELDLVKVLQPFQTQSHKFSRFQRTDDPGSWRIQSIKSLDNTRC